MENEKQLYEAERNNTNEVRCYEMSYRLVELRDRADVQERELKDTKAQIDELEKQMIENMTNDEISSFKRNGVMFSMAIREIVSAKPETKDELYSEVKKNGFEYLFTINAQTFGKFVKDITEENNGEMPKWLDGKVQTYEKHTIRVSKSK
jgi:hypothetical protein